MFLFHNHFASCLGLNFKLQYIAYVSNLHARIKLRIRPTSYSSYSLFVGSSNEKLCSADLCYMCLTVNLGIILYDAKILKI